MKLVYTWTWFWTDVLLNLLQCNYHASRIRVEQVPGVNLIRGFEVCHTRGFEVWSKHYPIISTVIVNSHIKANSNCKWELYKVLNPIWFGKLLTKSISSVYHWCTNKIIQRLLVHHINDCMVMCDSANSLWQNQILTWSRLCPATLVI